MNDRIDELKRQAIMWCDQNIPGEFDAIIGGYGHHWEEKFAELIVQECADYFGREGDRRFEVDGNWIALTIKQHFGVAK